MADETNQKIAAWLPSPVSCLVRTIWKWRKASPTSPDHDQAYIVRYDLKDHPPEAERQSAIAMLEQLNQPAGQQFATLELTRLKVLTKSRERGDDLKLQIAVMAEELGTYPPDVVREACRTWRSTWFPSWAELRDECDAAAKMRRDLLKALR